MKNIISLILIAVSILLFFFYTQPEYATISGLQEEKAGYEDALAKSKDLKTLSDSLLAQYDAITPADKAKLAAMIPDNFNSVKLVADINAIAARYGMNIKSVAIQAQADANNSQSPTSVTAAVPVNSYKTTSISFSISGQYANFISFLKDLEANEELIDVRKLDVHGAGIKPGTLDYGVIIETYSIN